MQKQNRPQFSGSSNSLDCRAMGERPLNVSKLWFVFICMHAIYRDVHLGQVVTFCGRKLGEHGCIFTDVWGYMYEWEHWSEARIQKQRWKERKNVCFKTVKVLGWSLFLLQRSNLQRQTCNREEKIGSIRKGGEWSILHANRGSQIHSPNPMQSHCKSIQLQK